MTHTDWDRRFLELAEHVARWSKDRSTKVGAVIVGSRRRVLSMGYNGPTRGMKDDLPELQARPEKYFWAEHGERNAIYNATESLEGATIYVHAWPSHDPQMAPAGYAPCRALPICMDCARAIVQTGIERVVTWPVDRENERWSEHVGRTPILFGSAGVEHVEIER